MPTKISTLDLAKQLLGKIKDAKLDIVGIDGYDFGDLGNVVGTVLGNLSREDLEDFIRGIEHGVSLTNGSHDDRNKPMTFINIRTETEYDVVERVASTKKFKEDLKRVIKNENI